MLSILNILFCKKYQCICPISRSISNINIYLSKMNMHHFQWNRRVSCKWLKHNCFSIFSVEISCWKGTTDDQITLWHFIMCVYSSYKTLQPTKSWSWRCCKNEEAEGWFMESAVNQKNQNELPSFKFNSFTTGVSMNWSK